MRINQFRVIPYSIPFVKPLRTAENIYSHREGLWLNIKWEDCSGWGEAAPLIGFSQESLKSIHYALEGFHHLITGETFEKEELISLVEIHFKENPSAQFAIETAIYDLLAQNANKSLSAYLNSSSKSEISVNGLTGIHLPGDDFTIMKVKVGFRNLFDEIEHMEKLTHSFGNDILFRLDANGAFNLPQAIRFCKEMEVFNIDYIEQPLPATELLDLAELIYHTDIPIAVDESLIDINSAEKIIEEQAAHVFIIKPMVSGGFTESKKIIQLARQEDVRAVITSSLETSIGRMACLHLALANEISEICGLATGELLNDEIVLPSIKNGIMQVPNKPGLGIGLEV